MKRISMVLVLMLAVLLTYVGSAMATASFADGVTVDTAPVYALAAIVLVGLGGIWAVRKCIKLMNRS